MAATAVARRGLAAVLLLGRRRLLPCPSPPPARRLLLSAAATSLRPLRAAVRRCSQVVGSPSQEGQLSEQDAEPPKGENEDAVFLVRAQGFPFSCSEEDVLTFFDGCRIRNGENGIHFLLNRDGRRRGDALIELESKADVQKALEKNLRYMGPRYVKVFEVHDRDVEGLLQSLQNESQAISDGVVLLRGLPFTSTEDDIADFFSGLRITDIAFVYRGERKSGEAYVQFAAPEMAAKALLKHKEYMGSRYIEVYVSRKQQMQRHVPYHKQLATFPRLRRELELISEGRRLSDSGSSNVKRQNQLGNEETENSRHCSEPGSTSSSPHIVHVRGFPTQTRAQDIINFFAPLKPTRIMVEYNSHGDATGEADVHFESHDDAVTAMTKEGTQLQCGTIELFLNEHPKAKQDC
ncbi:G-rich sequence factor 1 [Oxyura jamaicensis]|uniref:G-rich sequence factor 1 n=1 Tax=Oxyura jamaicensis TaxID=8884 RepID=UPI0015A665FD|nr:G-rich sequence factor 1 [Oxyura jamaicensis]XP_035181193.1 G-rich sequence factor 1 [Oxyura jamaicensis]XP_035181194.1 G-rich sequence factor 1 [Oxyura jamaicensis]XP_035181195.1 G-rich sequence factor 1 [Oxyura jamaicensis]